MAATLSLFHQFAGWGTEWASQASPLALVEEVRGDDPALASYRRIEERELEAAGVN